MGFGLLQEEDSQAEACATKGKSLTRALLLEARHLRKTYSAPRSRVAAVDDVSLELAAGETLAIVGESGSGITTLARMLLRLIEPDSGDSVVDGTR